MDSNNIFKSNKQLIYITQGIERHETKLKNESLYPLQVAWIEGYVKSLKLMMERIMDSDKMKELSFQDWDHDRKLDYVKRNRLCLNCLKGDHIWQKCKLIKCYICSKPHHHLLHKM